MGRAQDDEAVLDVLRDAATAVGEALAAVEDRLGRTDRVGQYALDVVTDAVVVPRLLDAGFGVFSEETGLHHPDRGIVVVVDPVDGSTNASRGIPWYASSLCAVDADGPRAAVVANLASGDVFDAVRGGGARLNGVAISPTSCTALAESLLVVNGLPDRHWGWGQFRSLGAAALDLCAVACGTVDGFVDMWPLGLAPWDYLGALLVCREAGAPYVEAHGRELVVLEEGTRRVVIAASTDELLRQLVASYRRPAERP